MSRELEADEEEEEEAEEEEVFHDSESLKLL